MKNIMTLSALLMPLGITAPNVPLSGLSLDNRNIQQGMVFIAIKGTQRHGIEFALAAQQQGAVAVLYDDVAAVDLPELSIPLIAVPQLAEQLGSIAATFYAHPSIQPFMVGITGTDGKTSVSHFIAEALNAYGQAAAVLGTLGSGLPGQLQASTHTTPDAINVQARLASLGQQGFANVIMEVSSHALTQGRVNAVHFDVAVLTNLTRDHLDFHGSMANYAEAKRKLFHWPTLKHIVVNLDDAFGEDIAEEAEASGATVLCYGIGEQDEYPDNSVVATATRFDHTGIWAQVMTPYGEGELFAPVLGQFNLHNLLAALSVLLVKGIPLEAALAALQQVKIVAGRMERVGDANTNVLVVVDYAHTPGALGQVLKALRSHTKQRLICVFGCGGDRDRGKRPLMAHAAEQLADYVIVADDNPRTESPKQIFDDIAAGFSSSEAVLFEHDRQKAIRTAIQAAQAGDVVLIAGKGHEAVQIVKDKVIAFDDREQARRCLQECTL